MTDVARAPGEDEAGGRQGEPAVDPIYVTIGETPHFRISYLESMGDAGRELAEGLRESVEDDYLWLLNVYGKDVPPIPTGAGRSLST